MKNVSAVFDKLLHHWIHLPGPKDDKFIQAMFYAIQYSCLGCVKSALDHGADPEGPFNEMVHEVLVQKPRKSGVPSLASWCHY